MGIYPSSRLVIIRLSHQPITASGCRTQPPVVATGWCLLVEALTFSSYHLSGNCNSWCWTFRSENWASWRFFSVNFMLCNLRFNSRLSWPCCWRWLSSHGAPIKTPAWTGCLQRMVILWLQGEHITGILKLHRNIHDFWFSRDFSSPETSLPTDYSWLFIFFHDSYHQNFPSSQVLQGFRCATGSIVRNHATKQGLTGHHGKWGYNPPKLQENIITQKMNLTSQVALSR